jgi:8-oxo-dGTP pyrophosphatase MutT (NUDIX family)
MTNINLIQRLQKRFDTQIKDSGYSLNLHPENSGIMHDPNWNHFGFKHASVLIILFPIRDSLHFFLTKRTEHVEHHKGQISLPGGSREQGETVQQTAIRESHEELGIQIPEHSIMGALTPFNIAVSKFRVFPFFAFTSGIPQLNPDSREVEKVLTPSIHSLLDDSNFDTEIRRYNKQEYLAPFFNLPEGKIWGATAYILSEFKAILKEIS